MTRAGDGAIPVLVQALDDPNPPVRRTAVGALEHLRELGTGALVDQAKAARAR
ncbi:MAG: armadillo/beta-catenin-like repeat-containing protein [Polyangiaceae bacterium]